MSWAYASTSDQALSKEFSKDARMLPHSAEPINLETPPALLSDAITPHERFYAQQPRDADDRAGGLEPDNRRPGRTPLYAHIRRASPDARNAPGRVSECYGNGRQRFAEQGQPAEGLAWRNGAIGNAEWTGVPVAHLLERAGVRRDAVQVECRGGGDHQFARGVEVAKLLDDAILAYAMNG